MQALGDGKTKTNITEGFMIPLLRGFPLCTHWFWQTYCWEFFFFSLVINIPCRLLIRAACSLAETKETGYPLTPFGLRSSGWTYTNI